MFHGIVEGDAFCMKVTSTGQLTYPLVQAGRVVRADLHKNSVFLQPQNLVLEGGVERRVQLLLCQSPSYFRRLQLAQEDLLHQRAP